METTETNTNIGKHNYAIYIFVLIIVLIVSWVVYSSKNQKPSKASIEERIWQVTELRATKKQKLDQIDKLQEEVYILDQKIIAWKCSYYADVDAKETWDTQCKDFYESQQSKIEDSSDLTETWSDE